MREFLRNPWVLMGASLAVVVGFLLFRPDTLVTDVRVSEQLETAFATTTLASTEPTSPVETTAPTTTAVTVPQISQVTRGPFAGINHEASGTATVYSQDGRYVLRFEEDTNIQNGPDLYVWLLPSDSFGGGEPTEYLDLGTLTGNVGSQNYPLPDQFDPAIHRTVLIWCLRFAVPFATAPLS